MKTIIISDQAGTFAENKDVARELRINRILPALAAGEDQVMLDFAGVTGATQSFVHALISEVIREYGDAVFDRLYFKNCTPAIQQVINIVADYMEETKGKPSAAYRSLVVAHRYNEGKMELAKYLNILWLCVTVVVLIALQVEPAGFVMLAVGLAGLWLCPRDFRRDMALVYGCVALLGLTPINTSTEFPHTLTMGIPLFLVVFGPYCISKYVYKNNLVRFPFGRGREWQRRELFYVLFTATVGFLLLPLMLRSGDSYLNWEIEPGAWNMAESYIGLNVVGIWDELFFVSTLLGIYRRHLPFWLANAAQAVFFTSFLYTLGFQGWCPLVIFPFALTQGYIFKHTDSLLYVLTIHLTLDLVLHLALVYLHYPHWLPFFVT